MKYGLYITVQPKTNPLHPNGGEFLNRTADTKEELEEFMYKIHRTQINSNFDYLTHYTIKEIAKTPKMTKKHGKI